jgi:hypothetical protein
MAAASLSLRMALLRAAGGCTPAEAYSTLR